MSDVPLLRPCSVASTRRTLVQAGAAALLLGAHHIARGASIVAVRVWPAQDYSRITIESDEQLSVTQSFVPAPPRLAVDIKGIELNASLRELVGRVVPNDPNIAGIRVGQYTPDVVRLVVDLKRPSKPQVFTLAPVAAYKHRLVFDLYPEKTADPLQELLAERLHESQSAPLPAGPKTETELVPEPSVTATEETSGNDPLGELIARHHAPPASPPASPRPSKRKAPDTAVVSNTASAPDGTTGTTTRPAKRRAPQATDRIILIAIDPGHGGEDPGAIGPKGTKEKDVALKIAQLLRQRVNTSSVGGNPMRAYLTRDTDFLVPLAMRVAKARRVQADLFISIHADAFTKPSARGASVFALSRTGASSETARWLANKENQADLIGGVNIGARRDRHVQQTLLDMSTTAQIKDSLQLGGALLGEIGAMARLHKPRVERAGFVVLKAPDIPSVLVETGFISNPEEEAKLRSPAYQKKLADALMRGIQHYFAQNPPQPRNRSV